MQENDTEKDAEGAHTPSPTVEEVGEIPIAEGGQNNIDLSEFDVNNDLRIVDFATPVPHPSLIDETLLKKIGGLMLRTTSRSSVSVRAFHNDGSDSTFSSVDEFIRFESNNDIVHSQVALRSRSTLELGVDVTVRIYSHGYPNWRLEAKGPHSQVGPLCEKLRNCILKQDPPDYQIIYKSALVTWFGAGAIPLCIISTIVASHIWAFPARSWLSLIVIFGIAAAIGAPSVLRTMRDHMFPPTQYVIGLGRRRYDRARGRTTTISVLISIAAALVTLFPVGLGVFLPLEPSMIGARIKKCYDRARIDIEYNSMRTEREKEEKARDAQAQEPLETEQTQADAHAKRMKQLEEAEQKLAALVAEEDAKRKRRDYNSDMDAELRKGHRGSLEPVDFRNEGRRLSRVGIDSYFMIEDTESPDPAVTLDAVAFEVHRIQNRARLLGFVEDKEFECVDSLDCDFSLYSRYCDKLDRVRLVTTKIPLPKHNRRRVLVHEDCGYMDIIDYYR